MVAVELATYNKPVVEVLTALELVKLRMLPVVNALAVIVIGVDVVAVFQFHVCAKFELLMVFVPVAAVKELSALEDEAQLKSPEALVVKKVPAAPAAEGQVKV